MFPPNVRSSYVIPPKAIRASRQLEAGTRLTVEETVEGVLHRPMSHFARTELANVFGSLRSADTSKSIEEMNAAILAEARRRHAGH